MFPDALPLIFHFIFLGVFMKSVRDCMSNVPIPPK